ncbi:MAG: hypothetical protein B7O98_00935 [Zestosphaera tikiterensis]|uniref:Peptidase M20 dimerisation domain-containing protein n=1 Tax=Zestosphaera tikiterensis TaxID=1973259 RepID=A0A2R7Y9L9_9CREN|nr:MAG: hypothetical protein B7O98_00935 [Zestosphaera tikiterensis]
MVVLVNALVGAFRNEVLELLKQLVSYPTVNDPSKNLKPSKDIVEFMVDWFKGYGIDVNVLESNGYYSVYGLLGSKPCVMLLAHFDVVPVALERWHYDPFNLTVVDDKAYGRGALDDKSNVAAIMIAVRELSKESLDCGVAFAFTGDEEIGGANGAGVMAKKLESEGLIPKYLINGDGMGMNVIVRRRKAFNVTISVPALKSRVRGFVKKVKFTAYYPTSQHAHAAYFIPGVDSHPLLTASVFVREGSHYVRQVRGTFLKSNVIPSEVELEYVTPDPQGEDVEVDLNLTELLKSLMSVSRTPLAVRGYSDFGVTATPNMYSLSGNNHVVTFDVRAMAYVEDVEKAFNDVVMNTLRNAEVKVRSDPGGYMNTPLTSKLVTTFLDVLREAGFDGRVGEGAGASDSRYFTLLGVESIDFGPRGGGMHGDDEFVDIPSLTVLPELYVKAVKKLVK